MALANIDPIIELIRHARRLQKRKLRWLLIRGSWATLRDARTCWRRCCASGMAGARVGVRDGLYYLTEQQAQAILDRVCRN